MVYEIFWQPPSPDTVDLEHYGHEKTTSWEDLSNDEQNEILDLLREQQISMFKDIKKR